MTQIEIQIVELLKQGFKYEQIQDKLNVSSKTIAAAKKADFTFRESKTDFPYKDTFQASSDSLSDNNESIITDSIEKMAENNIVTPKKQNIMSTNDDYPENATNTAKLELEKYKLQLSYDLELKKFNAEREDRKRELDLLEQELQLKRANIDFSNKVEAERRTLINRTRKIVYSCQDRAFSEEAIEKLLKVLIALKNECEQFCTKSNIEFRESECLKILIKIEGNLAEFLDTFEPDEYGEMDLTFDYALRELEKQTTFQSI